ncbi:MAG: carbohydrate binding family 9 domain-containing protein [Bacteroidales bacterium]|nr:carbohydrate binding family 9 domain-containing protein [Bacteroidales bacterium]
MVKQLIKNKFGIIISLFLHTHLCLFSYEDTTKTIFAVRTTVSPKIDGILEDVWFQCPEIYGFTQTNPYYGQKPTFDTKVYILYDNSAIYIAAFMFDSYPDSILKQLGNRDHNNLNADYFSIAFDPYNKQQDAYWFGVFASGVQFDRRNQDPSYNAVWQSCTNITDTGWIAEIKIPYSAIRFPKKDIQEWKIQIVRYIRRNRQESRLSPEPREANNSLLYWVPMKGLEQIHPPVRLSLTPYLTAGIQVEHNSNLSTLINGGTDLKYGIDESYTLDITLLPDFSQVQSDDKYKNLTAYETVYEEQRPFFKESVDLFNKGGIFYSRRIGKTPKLFYTIAQYMDSNETLKKNPPQTQLINAFKISGRDKKGLALGILNAVTSNTHAIIEDTLNNTRKVLTEPWANYNVFVIDKAIRRGNNIFLTNTNYFTPLNVNSNVCATGLTLTDKQNIWQLSTLGATSIFYQTKPLNAEIPEQGYKTNIAIDKIYGKLKFGISNSYMDKHFNANYVGLTLYNNYLSNSVYIKYQTYEPNKTFLNYGYSANYTHEYHNSSMKLQNSVIQFSYWSTTHGYTSIWTGISFDVFQTYDFYEPRYNGFYFISGKKQKANFGISTDYRKKMAIDLSSSVQFNKTYNNFEYYLEISPLARLSDHFSFRYKTEYEYAPQQIGFAAIDYQQQKPLFGKRNVATLTNSFTGNYYFKNDLFLSIRFRHYISQGKYNDLYILNHDGTLTDTTINLISLNNYHFSYQNFTLDLVFSWQFAPGSNLMLIWKNEIIHESNKILEPITEHIAYLGYYPQKNTILLKMLYYLDYEYIFKNLKK